MNEKKIYKSLRYWLTAAAIGGVYAVLTIALAPISYGPIQLRVSEALTVLPYFTPAAIPGLFVGCIISNIMSPYPLDIVIGSLATLLAAILSYLLRKKMWLVPMPPVIVNALAIGIMIWILYGPHSSIMLITDIGTVGAGEALSCYVIGIPLLMYLKRHKGIFDDRL